VFVDSFAALLKVATTLPAPIPIFWIKLDFDELPIVSDTFLSALYLKSFSSFAGAASEIGAADPSANAMLSFLTPDT